MAIVLYTFWRSQAAFRVRIALRVKRLEAEMVFVDLLKGEQLAESYRALSPAMLLPALLDGHGPPLIQSLAILEYLEERYPVPPLLPEEARARAHVRAVAHMVAIDAHPFVVPRVRSYLERELRLDEPARAKWLRHWLDSATRAVEDLLSRDERTRRFCYGDEPTMADICLFAHLTSAKMLYGCDLDPYPTVKRIYEACEQVEAFALAHPLRQPDTAQVA
ncbi:MAG TPA: maleylacetoacetate isomerase [Beijerinckiaceae bacterium]|jgi:maleylacetoacetate isomerase